MNRVFGWVGAGLSVAVPILAALFWIFQLKADMAANARAIGELQQQIVNKADADDINRLDQDIRDLRKSLEDAELIDRRK